MKKLKAVTFSFDDGIEQDKQLIEILDRYNLKCTFNINSGWLGRHYAHKAMLFGKDTHFDIHRIPKDEIADVYKNHEVAAHSVTHPMLSELPDNEVIAELNDDAITLEEITGQKVFGFAYPSGNVDARVAKLIGDNTGLYYGRTAKSGHSFNLPKNLMMFDPTLSHRELDERERLADEFLALEPDRPQMFYIWGHSYEMINKEIWQGFERFCEKLAGRNDIFYGTNNEVFKYFSLK